jgi:hypothetical protein
MDSLETSTALLLFGGIVADFISDFTSNRLAVMENCLDPGNSHPVPNKYPFGVADAKRSSLLSDVERSRLARAFTIQISTDISSMPQVQSRKSLL